VRTHALCALLLTAVAAAAQQATPTAPAPTFTYAADLAYAGKFIARGRVINDDPVLHPSVTIRHRSGLSLLVWGVMETSTVNNASGELTEMDYFLDYTRGPQSFGLLHYQFPHVGVHQTTELYAIRAWDGPLSPSASVYWDVDSNHGVYLSVDGRHRVPLKADRSLVLTGRVGLRSPNYCTARFRGPGVDKWAPIDLTLTAGLPLPAGSLVVTPYVTASTLVDGDLRRANNQPDNVFAGLQLSKAF
jgi:hypothetical protein